MTYLEAVSMASAELKAGRIVAYSTSWTPDTGSVIHFEYPGAGWCPHPAWQEYEDESPDGVGDYLPDY